MVTTTHTTSDIQVHAHVEYETRFAHLAQTPHVSYGICDRRADSCVVGSMAKVTSVTMRKANLDGYDPKTTRSASLPIVSAILKTMSAENVPILHCINETVYNQNSPITLLSEYQMREHGIVVDSVATKHNSTHGTPGTQTLCASDVVRCPLLDRGGLMGITLYPVEDGDEDLYEMFDLTSDQPWTPRYFMSDSMIYHVETP